MTHSRSETIQQLLRPDLTRTTLTPELHMPTFRRQESVNLQTAPVFVSSDTHPVLFELFEPFCIRKPMQTSSSKTGFRVSALLSVCLHLRVRKDSASSVAAPCSCPLCVVAHLILLCFSLFCCLSRSRSQTAMCTD